MLYDFPKPAIIIPAPKELLKPSRNLLLPSKGAPLVAMLPGMYPFVSGAGEVTIEHTDKSAFSPDGVAFEFLDESCGDEAADRIVLIMITARGSGTGRNVDSIEVNGSSPATLLVAANANDGAASRLAELWGIELSTGTTIDYLVTFDGTVTRMHGAVFALYGASSMTPSDSGTATDGDPTEIVIDHVAGGAVLAGAFNTTNGPSATWSGVVEDFDELTGPSDGNNTSTAAHAEFSAAGTVTCSVNWTAAGQEAMFAAAWSP